MRCSRGRHDRGPAMIAALRGVLTRWDAETSTLWVEVGGVTYQVLIPAYATEWVEAHRDGDEVLVYTYQHATERQPTPTLFGFPLLAERDFFRKFIEVPDVGPTKAVRALTRPVSEIARHIEAEDARALRQLPGVGERLSQTIVAHLKGKVVQEALIRDRPAGEPAAAPAALRDDAVEALVGLQYTPREAEELVTAVLLERPDRDTLEELLRAVLERQASSA